MAVSKVILNGTTLIDVTDDTVAADKLLSGYTATINTGAEVQGSIQTKTGSDITVNANVVSVPAGYYAVSTSGTVPMGTITNNTTLPTSQTSSGTINRGSYIKIGAGYYPDTYYLAQSNNLGTKSITTADNSGTNISVDGYSNVNISGLTVPSGYAFTLNAADRATYSMSAVVQVNIGKNRVSQITIDTGGLVGINVGGLATVNPKDSSNGTFNIAAYVNSGDTEKTSSMTIIDNGCWATTNVAGSGTYYGRVIVGSGSATTPATTVTANPSISVNSSTGVITATASATKSVTPTVVAGYVGSGTAGTITVSGSNTQALTTLGATTYNTSTSDQTITSGKFLTGTQTIKAVTTSGNITAANIKDGTVVKVGDANNAGRIVNVTGTFTDASTVSPGQTAASSSQILSGYSAWVDGEEVEGDISTKTSADLSVSGKTVTAPAGFYATNASASVAAGTVTSGSASITSLSYTYDSSAGKFNVTGSGNVSAPTVGEAGYISTTEGTRNQNAGGATVTTTVNKITGSTSLSGKTAAVTPSISKQTISISGVTDAASGSATTTAPSSGVYVAVKSAEDKGTITATPSVSSSGAGYGTSSNHGITGNSATVGANASAVTYVPITTTSASVSGDTVTYGTGWITGGSKTVSPGSVTQNAPTINTSTGLVTATSTVTAGYVTADTKSNTLQLSTKAAATYNTSTSDQEIAAGKYLTGKQTIKAVTTSGNITASNIRDGVTVKVGDANSAGRIINVTGSFTDSSTVSPGQTAASTTEIRTGYSAWVDGAEVTGSLGNSSMSEGVTTVSGTTATRGELAWTAGVTTAGTLEPASFSNSVATGKTADDYVNISSTSEAPVLVSGGYLYINKGYTDDVKISLAKLVPDGASANLAEGHILSGYSAYNNDGTLVAGNIPTKTSVNLSASGKTVTVPAGYYAQQYTKDVADGTITNNTTLPSGSSSSGTINRGSYIKIGAGYHPETYYMAQTDNLGTKSITEGNYANTNISVDGYSNVNISGISVPYDTGFTLNLVDADRPDYTAPTAYIGTGRRMTITDTSLSVCTFNNLKGSYLIEADESKSLVLQVNAYSDSSQTGRTGYKSLVLNGVWATTNVSSGGTYYGQVIVSSGSATTPATSITANPGISVNTSTGLITATASVSKSVTPTVSAGYVSSGTAGTVTVSGSNTSQLSTVSGITITPTESVQTAVAANKYTLGAVKIGAISSTYVGSGITQRNSSSLSASGATVTAPSGYYSSNATYTISSGSVTPGFNNTGINTYFNSGTSSSNSISITPKYSNSAGYITAHTDETGSATYYSIKTATPVFDGGTLSGGSTAEGTNVTLSSTNNGIMLQTKYSAASTDVLYNGAVEGWVSKANDAQALAGKTLSSTNGTSYYISGVSIPVPASGTNTFTVALPNGAYDPIVLTFEVDSNGNSNVTSNDDILPDATGVMF